MAVDELIAGVMLSVEAGRKSREQITALEQISRRIDSVRDLFDQAKTAWETGHPGSKLTIATDSSAALETQIEQGAPADVFLSADTTNPTKTQT